MLIAQFSDTHGLPRKPVPEAADVVVHSGDLCPNRTRGNRSIEPPYQIQWLEKTARDWARWLGGRMLLLVEGNHDFVDPAAILRRYGINALNLGLHAAPVDVGGLTFAGLSDIPWIEGEWAHEEQEVDIHQHFTRLMDQKPDVIIAHCPPAGVLDDPFDYVNYRIGSTSIATILSYHEHEPLAYLCGHCHERGGKEARVRSTLISNAATTRRLVEIAPRLGI